MAFWSLTAAACGGSKPDAQSKDEPARAEAQAAAEAPARVEAPKPPAPRDPPTVDAEAFGAWLDELHGEPDLLRGVLLEEPGAWFSQHFDPETAQRLTAAYVRDRESYLELLPRFLARGAGSSLGADGTPRRTPFVVSASDGEGASRRQADAIAAATKPLALFGFDTRKDRFNGDDNGARVESFVFHEGRFVYVGDLTDAVPDPPSCAAVRHHPAGTAPKPEGDRLELGHRAAGLAVDDRGQTVAVSRLDGPWLWRRTSGEVVRLPYREHWSFCVEIAEDKSAQPAGFRWSAVMDGRGTPWHERARHALAMTPGAETLYFGGHDGSVLTYALGTPQPRPELLYRHQTSVVDIDVSGDGALVVSAGFLDGPILWDGKVALRMKDGRRDRSLTVAFSPDARHFVVAQPLRFWEVGGALEPFRTEAFLGNHPFTLDVAWSPDGLVVGAGEGIEVWDVSAKESKRDERFESTPYMTSMSPDGAILATSHEGFVQLWEPHKGKKTERLDEISGVTMAMAWSPNGRFLALADADGMQVQVRAIAR